MGFISTWMKSGWWWMVFIHVEEFIQCVVTNELHPLWMENECSWMNFMHDDVGIHDIKLHPLQMDVCGWTSSMMMLMMMLAYIHDTTLLHEWNQLKFYWHLKQFKILMCIKWMLKLHFLMMIFQKKYMQQLEGFKDEM